MQHENTRRDSRWVVKGTETLIEGQPPVASAFPSKIFTRPIIAAGGFDPIGAEEILIRGDADLVAAFGRWFASNPDLPERLRHNRPLARYERDAFWGGDERGYADYPEFEQPAR